jgi:hypothetical protein
MITFDIGYIGKQNVYLRRLKKNMKRNALYNPSLPENANAIEASKK